MIIAYKIDYKYIYYKCDNCIKINKRIINKNNTNKDFKLFASFHIHNSFGDLSNRTIKIKNHCLHSNIEYLNLVINNDTLKIYNESKFEKKK